MRRYQNPLKIWTKSELSIPDALPDPYVIRYLGQYYCYSTGEKGIPVLRSSDLCQWEYLGFALCSPEEHGFWAPCVFYENGVFYLYYSSTSANEEDCHCERLKVAASNTPEGPFSYVHTLFSDFSIDPHVVKEKDGAFSLYYAENKSKGCDVFRPGTSISRSTLETPLSMPKDSETILTPSRDEEIFAKNRFGDGRDWHTLEGPFYFSEAGYEYLMYSGNAYTNEQYFVGYAVKNSQDRWEKVSGFPNLPLLKKKGETEGTGHNCVVKAPNLVDSWIIYHGREVDAAEKNCDSRRMRMDRLYIGNQELWCAGPTHFSCPAPGTPKLFERFSEEDESFLHRWDVLNGVWVPSQNMIFQRELYSEAGMVSKETYQNYLLEVSLRTVPSHLGNVYGVYLDYLDRRNYDVLLLDAGKGALILRKCRSGMCFEKIVSPLPIGFNHFVWHTLMIEKVSGKARVFLDGMEKGWVNLFIETGKFGLATEYTNAYFTGITVTEYASLHSENQEEFFSLFSVDENEERPSGQWMVKEGVLSFQGLEKGSEISFKRCGKSGFQLNCRMKISSESTLGIRLKDKDQKKHCYILFKQEKIIVVQERNGNFIESERIRLREKRENMKFVLSCSANDISLYSGQKLMSCQIGFLGARWGLFTTGKVEISQIEWVALKD